MSLQGDWSCVGSAGFLTMVGGSSGDPSATWGSMMRRHVRIKRPCFEFDTFYIAFWNTEEKLKFSAGFGTAYESFDFSKSPPLTAWSEDGNVLSDDAITADRCSELVKQIKSKKSVFIVFPVKQRYRQ